LTTKRRTGAILRKVQNNLLLNIRTDTKRAKILIGTAFLLYFMYFALASNKARNSESPWSYGEWLISYASGYQRRGLSGTFILGVSDFFHLDPLWLIFSTQILGFGTLLILLFRTLTRHEMPLISLVGVFSPMAIFYSLVDEAVVGRKELFLYILCLAWFEFWKNHSHPEIGGAFLVKCLLFSLGLFILLLTHEGLAVFFPLLLTTLFVKRFFRADISRQVFAIGIATIAAPVILIAITLFFLPQKSSVAELCAPLIEFGITQKICSGAIDWSARSGGEGIGYALTELGLLPPSFLNYIPVAVVTLLVSVSALILSVNPIEKELALSKVSSRAFSVFIFVALALTLPLYIIAFDWGRYLSITVTIISFATLYVISDDNIRTVLNNSKTHSKIQVPISWWVAFGVLWLFFGVSHYGGEYSSIGMTIAQILFQILTAV